MTINYFTDGNYFDFKLGSYYPCRFTHCLTRWGRQQSVELVLMFKKNGAENVSSHFTWPKSHSLWEVGGEDSLCDADITGGLSLRHYTINLIVFKSGTPWRVKLNGICGIITLALECFTFGCYFVASASSSKITPEKPRAVEKPPRMPEMHWRAKLIQPQFLVVWSNVNYQEWHFMTNWTNSINEADTFCVVQKQFTKESLLGTGMNQHNSLKADQ